MKKALVIILLIAIALSFKFSAHYKKLLILVGFMCILPLGKTLINLYDSLKPIVWLQQPDNIENIIFKQTPNIYLIQPDGYVGKEVLEKEPYNYKSDLYDWLETNTFKIYPNFKSNYPATLLSNASMFGMKHHYFGDVFFPGEEMIHSRDIIVGNNPVIDIFKRNDYATSFLASAEYFQLNYPKIGYDYVNIKQDEIQLFNAGFSIKNDVFLDLKEIFEINKGTKGFYFIEKLEPHRTHLKGNLIEERITYLEGIENANIFIKKTVGFIDKNDPNAIIIILADHGGYVGVENQKEANKNSNPIISNSIFSTLAAIKWNGHLIDGYDKNLTTSVNLFRVLFSILSEEKTYLDHLENDSIFILQDEKALF